MTVKQLCNTVKAESYTISSQGMALPLDPGDPLQMEAYGAFAVAEATATIERGLEISIKTAYIREEG